MSAPTIITSPTCRYKLKLKGDHKPILYVDPETGQAICSNCQYRMWHDVANLLNASADGPGFCHECGEEFAKLAEKLGPGETLAVGMNYDDNNGPIILCESCNRKYNAKINGEFNAAVYERKLLAAKSLNAREAIREATTTDEAQRLYSYFLARLGHRPARKVKQ